VEVAVPAPGPVAETYAAFAEVSVLDYRPVTLPTTPRAVAQSVRRLFRDLRLFRRRIRETKPARVLAVTTTLPALVLAARAERVPVVVYAGEILPTGPGLGRRLGALLLTGITRRLTDGVICCSATVAAQFEGRGAPPLAVAYPPIADQIAGDGDALRRRHGIPADAKCVAAVGAISRGRGQDVLIEALPTVRAHFPGIKALIVGAPHPRPDDVSYRDELIQAARRLGVEDSVVLTGYVDRVADVYAGADAVVNPARREAFGRVAAEALIAGCPVVATRVEAVTEVLRDGVDALLVPPDSPAALAEALIRVLEEAGLARRLVDAGAARVHSEFSEEQSLEHFIAVVTATGDARVGANLRG
jgi:glycosyltransferase involved in cell wall biosynthesis